MSDGTEIVTWDPHEIARDARLAADEPELVTGTPVAWVTKYNSETSGVSAVHRVYDEKVTYCQREIPPADRRIAPLPSLNVCSRCETLCKRAESVLRRPRGQRV